MCAKFTRTTCLVPRRSDEFEGQGQRSKVKVARDKNALSAPVTPSSVRMICARCKLHAAAADGTIATLLGGVISSACVRCMFGNTSLALVFTIDVDFLKNCSSLYRPSSSDNNYWFLLLEKTDDEEKPDIERVQACTR